MGSSEEPLDVMGVLDQCGAILRNKHFVYTSGRHSANYVNMDPLYTNPVLVAGLVDALLDPFANDCFDTIAAPATGGIALVTVAGIVADRLFLTPTGVVWVERQSDGQFGLLRAGFGDHLYGKRVLVIDDVISNGTSVTGVCNVVEAEGGEVVGVSVICNTGAISAKQLEVARFNSLAELCFESFTADECPQCKAGVPIVEDIGHGAAYKTQHPDGRYVKLIPPVFERMRKRVPG